MKWLLALLIGSAAGARELPEGMTKPKCRMTCQ